MAESELLKVMKKAKVVTPSLPGSACVLALPGGRDMGCHPYGCAQRKKIWMGAEEGAWTAATTHAPVEEGRRRHEERTKEEEAKKAKHAAPGLPAWSPTAVLPGLDPA